jgi:hypothetical protein
LLKTERLVPVDYFGFVLPKMIRAGDRRPKLKRVLGSFRQNPNAFLLLVTLGSFRQNGLGI